MKEKNIAIVGAGLVGSLLSIYLSRRNYNVTIFERRSDMRAMGEQGGRSINLALSNRGLRALGEVGLAEKIQPVTIPLHGRMMHDKDGKLSSLPYGKKGQYINSVSRSGLNILLMNAAEQHGVKIMFDHRVERVDIEKAQLTFSSGTKSFDKIIGADGAFSAVRGALEISDRFDYRQHYIEHGYKELTIPPGAGGTFQLEKNALHIWPRESYMLIALPNPDGSFTCTLFFPFDGDPSFQTLTTEKAIREFFQRTFPDAASLIPDVAKDFQKNPASSLVTITCFPWAKKNILLLGDAAHAIVPFYGQGMNAGFEDCRVLNDLLNQHQDDWTIVQDEFQRLRKPDADAIAELALHNFVEMRDLVADPDFLLRKKIESRLHELFPERWIPLYSMVTFHDHMRYSEALKTGQEQKRIMDSVMKTPSIETIWPTLDFASIVGKLTTQR